MNYEAFYEKLFEHVITEYGSLDPKTRFHIIGFDGGGPVNYRTIGSDTGEPYVTCVTCELAPRTEQKANNNGRYELLMTCDDENWCSSTLTDIAQMSLDVAFGHCHTLDMLPWVGRDFPLQAIVFEQFATVSFEGQSYGIMRCHGITRSELDFARKHGSETLFARLKTAGIFPKTSIHRQSIDLK